jgi:uncharacterized membrane protein
MMDTAASITRNLPVLAFAAALATLGVLSLMSGDFGFQWQPMPKSLPDRATWATVIGGAEILTALALLVPPSRTMAATAAAALYVFWSLLHTPKIVDSPMNVAAWLGAAEPFAIAMGVLALAFARTMNTTLFDICVRAFGGACIIFGASHFAYAEFTAAMVPSWLPEQLLLAYATGAVHAGCGLALLIGFSRLIAAIIEAAMMSSFVLLVHVPRVAAAPSNRFEWTMMCASLLLTASAWIIASEFRANRPV